MGQQIRPLDRSDRCKRCPRCNVNGDKKEEKEPKVCPANCENGVVPCEQDDCMKGTKGFTGMFSKHPCAKGECVRECTATGCKGKGNCPRCQNVRFVSRAYTKIDEKDKAEIDALLDAMPKAPVSKQTYDNFGASLRNQGSGSGFRHASPAQRLI